MFQVALILVKQIFRIHLPLHVRIQIVLQVILIAIMNLPKQVWVIYAEDLVLEERRVQFLIFLLADAHFYVPCEGLLRMMLLLLSSAN